jgi:hypothetical protein
MARLSDDDITERLRRGDWRRDGVGIVRDLDFDDFKADGLG